MSFELDIPVDFRRDLAGRPADGGPDGDEWLASLPRLVTAAAARWSLTEPQPARYGACALVVPCSSRSEPVALKLTWPHPQARHEHLALRAWAGHGAVRLVAADVGDHALLLERLDPDRSLESVDLLEACELIGHLLRRLDRPALPQVDQLPIDAWRALLAATGEHVPRRLAQQAGALLSQLTPGDRLVHGDLHYANVLAGGREPWLAIDPKPVTADPAFGVAPVLWNRWPEAAGAHNLRAHLRLRLGIVAEAAGVDEDQALAWSFVRCVINAAECDPQDAALSRWITVAKAMI